MPFVKKYRVIKKYTFKAYYRKSLRFAYSFRRQVRRKVNDTVTEEWNE